MKIVKIANLAITVMLASLVASCAKEQPQEETPETPEINFTVQLSKADSDYAEVVVRHDGPSDATWFGFMTQDLESSVETLIQAQLANVNANSLHVGKSQTVAVRNLNEFENYRYVAFGVNSDGECYGVPGALAFCTSPVFNVTFQAEATEVKSHEATFAVSHDGIDVLTYLAFVTDDATSTLDKLAAEHYASVVGSNGKLNEGVELLKGASGTVTVDELTHETDYRFIIYGIYEHNGAIIYYGTPAEVKFTTPIDLTIVPFSAAISNITTDSAKASVTYDAKDEELTWYGFVTEDLTSPAATLIADKVSGLAEENLNTGKGKAIDITGLETETNYRFIVTGVNAQGAFGVPADVKFATLAQAYVDCVFTVVATEVKPTTATLTITHNGLEDFAYCGFLTDDLTSPVADVELPANVDSNLVTGLEKTVDLTGLSALTKYRYVVVGRVNGSDYGTRGEVIFETGDYAVAGSYEDFLGAWAITQGSTYEFTIEADVEGESYIISGLGGAETAKYGIGSPLKVSATFEGGKMILKSQTISDVYTDPDDGKEYTDALCGTYVSKETGNTYYDKEMGRVLVNFVLLEDGTVELRPGTTKDDEVYLTFRFYQVPEDTSGSAYAQDNYATTLPNIMKHAQTASQAYLKWIGQWNLNGTTYTIAKGETNVSYIMGSFYSGFTVNAPVDFDESTGDIIFAYGPTGQSVTASGTSYDLYKCGSYGENSLTFGDDDGIICRFVMGAGGNTANITPVATSNTAERFGLYGQSAAGSWANFGMEIDIPLTITRVSSSSVQAAPASTGTANLKRVKEASVPSFVK
jgi:hypothetical protein